MSQETKEREEKELEYVSDENSDYSGDEISDNDMEETSIDLKKNRSLYCNNKTISQFPISISDTENKLHRSVTLFVYHLKNTEGVDKQHIECILYKDLLKLLIDSSPLFFYTENVADENDPIYKLPSSGIYIQANFFMLSRYSCFELKNPQNVKIGSNFGISRIHGSIEKVYRAVPIIKSKLPEIKPLYSLGNAYYILQKTDYSPLNFPRLDSVLHSIEDINIETIIFPRNNYIQISYDDFNTLIYSFKRTPILKLLVLYKKLNGEYNGRQIDHEILESEVSNNDIRLEIKETRHNESNTIDITIFVYDYDKLIMKEKIFISKPYIEDDNEIEIDNEDENMEIDNEDEENYNRVIDLIENNGSISDIQNACLAFGEDLGIFLDYCIDSDRPDVVEFILNDIKSYSSNDALYTYIKKDLMYSLGRGNLEIFKVFIKYVVKYSYLVEILQKGNDMINQVQNNNELQERFNLENIRQCVRWLSNKISSIIYS